jgi:hypothetical protein
MFDDAVEGYEGGESKSPETPEYLKQEVVGSRVYPDTDLHVHSGTNRWDMDVYPGLRSSNRGYHCCSPSSPSTRSSSLLENSC